MVDAATEEYEHLARLNVLTAAVLATATEGELAKLDDEQLPTDGSSGQPSVDYPYVSLKSRDDAHHEDCQHAREGSLAARDGRQGAHESHRWPLSSKDRFPAPIRGVVS